MLAVRTTRPGGWRGGIRAVRMSCRDSKWAAHTFGSLRHCVEADLFAMTGKSLGVVTDGRGATISKAGFVGAISACCLGVAGIADFSTHHPRARLRKAKGLLLCLPGRHALSGCFSVAAYVLVSVIEHDRS